MSVRSCPSAPTRFSRSPGKENANETVEKRVNAFAAAFLLPAGGVADQLRLLGKGAPSRQAQTIPDTLESTSEIEIRPPAGSQTITFQDVRQIAYHFGVSYESVVWRLHNLGHLRQAEVGPLQNQQGNSTRLDSILKLPAGDSQPPPDDDRHGLEEQILRLAIEATRREEISQGRLRDLARRLDLDPDAVLALTQAALAH